jgi:hypothetical protein
MAVKQGRFYLRHNTLSEDIPIVIIFKVRLQKEFFLWFIFIQNLKFGRSGPLGTEKFVA